MGTNEKMHPVRLGNNNVIILRRVFVTKKNCVHGAEEVAANSDFFQKQCTHVSLLQLEEKGALPLFAAGCCEPVSCVHF